MINRLPFLSHIHLKRNRIEQVILILLLFSSLSVLTNRRTHKADIQLDQGKLHYTGSVVAHKMNGQGKLTFSNGDVYEGEFRNGLFDGQGTYTSASGWTYTGAFKKGYAHGEGKLTTEKQASYQGRFEQGIYHHAD